MKATGIVRRIDDLGRVVIPKEIRRTLHLKDGDPLEIYTASDGEVIFKKYSPMGELSEFTGQYCEVLSRNSGAAVLITDRDRVVCASGIPKADVLDRRISKQLEEYTENREEYIRTKHDETKLLPIENCDFEAALALPIISAGDISGALIFLTGEKYTFPNEADIKLAKVAASFLGKRMEE